MFMRANWNKNNKSFQLTDDFLQSGSVPLQTFFDTTEDVGTLTAYVDVFGIGIPFMGKHLIVRVQLPDYPIMDNLEIDASLLALHSGRSELYLY